MQDHDGHRVNEHGPADPRVPACWVWRRDFREVFLLPLELLCDVQEEYKQDDTDLWMWLLMSVSRGANGLEFGHK